jgi:hypothetical protein
MWHEAKHLISEIVKEISMEKEIHIIPVGWLGGICLSQQ